MATGGDEKIARNRRNQWFAATPYGRPPSPNNPNWFTGHIIPSARSFASSAGEIISAIFSESEYSSSEDDDDDFASEDEADSVAEYESLSDGVNALNGEKVTSPEMLQHGQESQFIVQKTETKRLIEQLIMQETFSREECLGLIKLLNSRVTDLSTEAGEKILLANTYGKIVDHEYADKFNKAVLEAEKWFQEKKLGSSSVTQLIHGPCNRSSTALEHVENGVGSPVDEARSLIMRVESGVGSPVDVARSYMGDRPPWAPLTKPVELRTPLTMMNLFKEGTSHSFSYETLSSSKDESERVESLDALDVGVNCDPALVDPHSTKISEPPATKVAEFGEKLHVNGFSSSQASLSSGLDVVQKNKQYNGKNHKDHKVSCNKSMNISNVEAYLEVPFETETDSAASVWQNNLNYEYEMIRRLLGHLQVKG